MRHLHICSALADCCGDISEDFHLPMLNDFDSADGMTDLVPACTSPSTTIIRVRPRDILTDIPMDFAPIHFELRGGSGRGSPGSQRQRWTKISAVTLLLGLIVGKLDVERIDPIEVHHDMQARVWLMRGRKRLYIYWKMELYGFLEDIPVSFGMGHWYAVRPEIQI